MSAPVVSIVRARAERGLPEHLPDHKEVREWVEELERCQKLLRSAIRDGWDPEDAVGVIRFRLRDLLGDYDS